MIRKYSTHSVNSTNSVTELRSMASSEAPLPNLIAQHVLLKGEV